jgi:translation initiation factor IF-2
MAKNPRLHEVAKVLGLQAKQLMADLASQGHELKTHMASLEEGALKWLHKKFPNLEKLLQESKKEKAEKAPSKPKAKKPSSKKMVTQRTRAQAGKKEEVLAPSEMLGRPKVEIVKKEGESVEQKVMTSGIIRRRRVEPSAAPPELPTQQAHESKRDTSEIIQDEPAELVASTASLSAQAPEFSEALSENFEALEQVSEAELVETEELEIQPEVVIAEEPADLAPKIGIEEKAPVREVEVQRSTSIRTFEAPKPSGRNLSAPRRLKVVIESTSPPASRPAPSFRKKETVASPATRVSTVTSPASETKPKLEAEAAEKEAAKKKTAALKNWDAPKVTKKELIGMTEEVEISRMGTGRKMRRNAPRMEKKTKITTPGQSKRKIKIEQEITVADLSDRMGIKAADVVRKLISMGQMVSAHQMIDYETAVLIAAEYDYEVQNVAQTAESLIRGDVSEANLEDGTEPRAPIVTIMGHVDHGKTSLLDYIRKSKVAAGEAGGITQHIGAYQIHFNDKPITFLDTPGHEAFTKMRARGASATDLVILVVAADEGVKPQTLEALAHAKVAKVPILVAINKMDKPEAQPDRVMQELAGHELVPEEWGGETIFCKVSAHTGKGVPELLEMILLQAEVLDLKANSSRPAKGIVIESRLDKGKGPVASVVLTNGTLNQGDPIVCSLSFGKVRAMFDDAGKQIKSAGPAVPVEILGFDSVPEAGEILQAVSEEGIARRASDLAIQQKRQDEQRRAARISLEEMYKKMKAGEVHELRVILKADVQGSLEAIADSLEKIQHKDVKVQVVYKAVGGISESDVSLAAASGALIVGFNVRPTNQAKQMATHENIQIKVYGIIYELIDDVKLAMQGLLAPIIKEQVLGQAEVRNVFNLSKVGMIAGCYVKSGKILRGSMARLIRDSVVIYDAKIVSLKRFKEDAREVAEGFECGIRIENYSDVKAGDVIECYEKVEMKAALGL